MEMNGDCMFEILSCLPAKAICKLKSTCKLFEEISSDTSFTLKQAQHASTKDDTCFFIQQGALQRFNCYTMLHPMPGEWRSSGIPRSVTEFFSKSARVISSSNGLILCRSTNSMKDELFIVNPVLKSYLQLPLPQGSYTNTFADLKIVLHCHSSDDFMLCLFIDPDEWSSYLSCNIYSHREGEWRTNENNLFAGGRNLRFDMPVVLDKVIYLISDCYPCFGRKSPYYRPYVVSYDLEDGNSRFLQLPSKAKRDAHDLGCQIGIFNWGRVNSCDQSICLVSLRKKVFTFWVLTELCSWRKVLKVRVKGMGLLEKEPNILGYTVLNGNALVFCTERKVYSYGLMGERCMMLEELCEHGCESAPVNFVSYSNTLHPLGVDAMPLPTTEESIQEEEEQEEKNYSSF